MPIPFILGNAASKLCIFKQDAINRRVSIKLVNKGEEARLEYVEYTQICFLKRLFAFYSLSLTVEIVFSDLKKKTFLTLWNMCISNLWHISKYEPILI